MLITISQLKAILAVNNIPDTATINVGDTDYTSMPALKVYYDPVDDILTLVGKHQTECESVDDRIF